MRCPLPDEYIDIHTHNSSVADGIFAIENIMAHEDRSPGNFEGRLCTYGIHPWHLTEQNAGSLIESVLRFSSEDNVIAIGEAGFDKLRGPAMELQRATFEKQAIISEERNKPMFIHCVRAWDELFQVMKRIKPRMPWMVHGFRSHPMMADQLVAKGLYLSFWVEFVIRPESSVLLRSVPRERIFLETDGAPVAIADIYGKAAADLDLNISELRQLIAGNFDKFFNTCR